MIKGSKMTLEQRKRLSEAHKGKPSPHKGKHFSEEHRKKLSEAQKKAWSNPELKNKQSEAHKGQITWIAGKKHTEEARKKMSEAQKLRFQNPEERRKVSEEMKGKHHSQKTEFKKGDKSWNTGKHFSEETKRRISEATKKRMDNPEIRKKMSEMNIGRTPWNKEKTGVYSKERIEEIKEGRARQVFPVRDSKPEIKIQNFLKELNLEFIAHKYMKIKHKYLCDLFIPSLNLVIECDGNYWHKYPIGREIDKIRTEEMIEQGFKVLRLWESDINKMNINEFKNKIVDAIRKP